MFLFGAYISKNDRDGQKCETRAISVNISLQGDFKMRGQNLGVRTHPIMKKI